MKTFSGWLNSFRLWQQPRVHLLLIVLCGGVAYANSFQVPFYFDDLICIVQNPVVHDLGNLSRLDRFWQLGISEDIRNNLITRFVTYLTFAANYRLHGLEVGGYHLVNLLIHLGNALLVYQLVRLLRAAAAPATTSVSGKGDGLALTVALLFITHPLQTNAVTYIVQRFASLATLFCLAALTAYLYMMRAATAHRRRQLYAGALLATVIAMFTKEIAFTLPVLISLCDLAFLGGSRRQRLRRLAPFWATMLLLPLVVITLAAHSEVTGGEVGNALDLANLGHGSRWDYFFTQWRVIVTYLRLLLLPVGLHLEYDYFLETSPWDMELLTSGLLLATLLGTGCWLLFWNRNESSRCCKLIGFGILWFSLTLAMESSIIRLDDLLFEYRLYLPSIGFFLAVGSCADLARQHLARNWPKVNAGTAAVVGSLILILAIATYWRNCIWQDDLFFWQDNVAKSPNRARSRCNLADSYLKRGEVAKAIVELETVIRINPTYWVAYESLGDVLCNQGLFRQAADHYLEAQRLGCQTRGLRLKLGRAQRLSGDFDAARKTFSTMLTLLPDDSEALVELAKMVR